MPALSTGQDPPDADPDWLPPVVRHADQVVLLVLDGLGWEQLRSRVDLAPTLAGADGIERAITSVAPTTTACALTSITTGRPPSEHGLLGYRLALGDQILNVLRWTLGSGVARDARREVPAHRLQPYPPFPGAPGTVPVVSKHEFGGTGFTAAHLGDSPLHGYRVLSSLPVEVGRLLGQGAPLVYAYYDGIDKVAHSSGLGELYDAELVAVDRLVGDLVEQLPPGAVLLVTADHGQIDVGPRGRTARSRGDGLGGLPLGRGPVPVGARPTRGGRRPGAVPGRTVRGHHLGHEPGPDRRRGPVRRATPRRTARPPG